MHWVLIPVIILKVGDERDWLTDKLEEGSVLGPFCNTIIIRSILKLGAKNKLE